MLRRYSLVLNHLALAAAAALCANRTPKERVWQIAKDANVASIVTQRAKADVLFAGHDGECAALCLDDPSVVSAIQSSPDSAMPADVTAALDANQLIYVIYTSGTRALVCFSFLFFSFLHIPHMLSLAGWSRV